jgi:hypothetical protein
MFVGFLGSHPLKQRDKALSVVKGSWRFLRAAISIVAGTSTLVFGIRGILAWLGTGKWPGPGLLDLIERVAGGPVLGGPPWPNAFSFLQEVIRWLLASTPAYLAGLLVGAWVAWKAFPSLHRAASTAAPGTLDWVRAEVRRIPGNSLAIVSRDRPRLFAYLEEALRDYAKARVIVDRRWGDRRYHHAVREPERRRQDRRRQADSTGGLAQSADVLVAPRVEEERPLDRDKETT